MHRCACASFAVLLGVVFFERYLTPEAQTLKIRALMLVVNCPYVCEWFSCQSEAF